MMTDDELLQHAILLAQKGEGFVNPHPMIGAVIAQNGEILSEGYYAFFGAMTAESDALNHCSKSVKGASLYLSLLAAEPETGLFFNTNSIIDAGISHIFIAALTGKESTATLSRLKEAGITVEVGLCEEICHAQNKAYFFWLEHHRPYVVIQYAMTLDGKIATKRAKHEPIISKAAQDHALQQRTKYSAVMLGISAALDDTDFLQAIRSASMSGSSQFTVDENEHQPLRIIFDTFLELPIHSDLVQSAKNIPLLICTTERDRFCYRPYLDRGCEILHIPRKGGRIAQVTNLMQRLGERGITSVYVEGGAEMHGLLFEAGLVDHIECYLTPKILSGKQSTSPVKGLGTEIFTSTYDLENFSTQQIGTDILMECDVLTTFVASEVSAFQKK